MAATLPPFPGTTGKRDWRTAFDAIRKLLANGDDTTQVFRIMRALNVGATPKSYAQFIATDEGGRMAYERVELAKVFAEPGYAQQFAPGTVGAAYAQFLESTGYSADGLAEISKINREEEMLHPYAWFGRRVRDTHDIWHILTGYQADESLGEAALVAFSYAQVGGLGWAFIAAAAALKSLKVTGNRLFAKAVWEGYRLGKKAQWLPAEDYEKLMAEPIDAARARLGLVEPIAYRTAQRELGPQMASYLSQRREENGVATAAGERLAA